MNAQHNPKADAGSQENEQSMSEASRMVITHATFSEWPKVFEIIGARGNEAALGVSELGYGLLHLAADRGADDALIDLLKLGLNPDLCDTNGESPLHWAAASDSDQSNLIVDLLIDAGVDVNKLNDKGASPLMIASMRGKNKAILTLIEKGANFNEQDMQSRPISDESKLIIRSAFAKRAAAEALQKINNPTVGIYSP